MVPLALVATLATRWHHLHKLQIWPPDGATCKFAHQMAPLALVATLTTRWHHLHKLQLWPPDGATGMSCKFAHQMAPLVLLSKLTTRLHYLYCYLLHWHYQLVLSWYPHQPESQLSQLSLNKVLESLTFGPNYRTPGLPGSDKDRMYY